MDLNKLQNFEEEQEEVIKFEWPQAYYLPTDAEKRKVALDRAIAENLDPNKDKIRNEIWERRYNSPAGVDRFLSGYMNLTYYANVVKGNLMAKFHRKDMVQTQEFLCYDIPEKYGADGEEMLYLELYHMIDYYIDICLRDKKYSGLIMGLGTMKKRNLINKIANDIYQAGYGLPVGFKLAPAHELFKKAAVTCFCNRFPKEKELLKQRIIESSGK